MNIVKSMKKVIKKFPGFKQYFDYKRFVAQTTEMLLSQNEKIEVLESKDFDRRINALEDKKYDEKIGTLQRKVKNNYDIIQKVNDKCIVHHKRIGKNEYAIEKLSEKTGNIGKDEYAIEKLKEKTSIIDAQLNAFIKRTEWHIENNKKVVEDFRKDVRYKYYRSLDNNQYKQELEDWFVLNQGHVIDWNMPTTYNEKIQWLKLYDSTELKTRLADKLLVREWVKDKIGEQYLIPLIGSWKSFNDIDFDSFPEQFVLKANHGCGYNIIVKNKDDFDIETARKFFNQWMSTNFAFASILELHYKNIKPMIIAEKYLQNAENDLYDYKVWCFNGKAEYVMFLAERENGLKMVFFDREWNKMPFVYSYPQYEKEVPKPDNLDELLEISEKLATGFAHVRVDFYRLNDGTYKFGEMTFTSASGGCKWQPPEYDQMLGAMIDLPDKSKFEGEYL